MQESELKAVAKIIELVDRLNMLNQENGGIGTENFLILVDRLIGRNWDVEGALEGERDEFDKRNNTIYQRFKLNNSRFDYEAFVELYGKKNTDIDPNRLEPIFQHISTKSQSNEPIIKANEPTI